MLTVSVNIKSMDFNGRRITEMRAWRIQREAQEKAQMPEQGDPFMNVSAMDAEDDGGDLPF